MWLYNVTPSFIANLDFLFVYENQVWQIRALFYRRCKKRYKQTEADLSLSAAEYKQSEM